MEIKVTTVLWSSEGPTMKVLTALDILRNKRGIDLVLCQNERDRDRYDLWLRGEPAERVCEEATIGAVTEYLRGKYGKKKGGQN